MSHLKPSSSTHKDIHRYNEEPNYNEVVIYNSTVYLAGQCTDEPEKDKDVASQTKAILSKIDSMLEAAGSHKSRILAASVWLTDVSKVKEFNGVWSQWLDAKNKPVRATVQAKLVAPEYLVEVQVTAALNPKPRTKPVKTDLAAAAVGPYNQAIITDDGMLFISGCIGLSPKTGDFAGPTVEEQAHQVLANLDAILKAGGGTAKDIIKTTILLDDMSDFVKVNAIYAEYFGPASEAQYPARATFAAKALPKGAKIEIEAIAKVH